MQRKPIDFTTDKEIEFLKDDILRRLILKLILLK